MIGQNTAGVEADSITTPQRRSDETAPNRSGFGRLDFAILAAILPFMILPVVVAFNVIASDWTFWTDWKDRVYWPLMTAAPTLLGLAAVQYVGWRHFRLPFATLTAVITVALSQFAFHLGHGQFMGFPSNFTWTGTIIPLALLLDAILIASGRIGLAGSVGAFAYGALFYQANAILIQPFLQAVDVAGAVLTVANLQGFSYQRSSVPEYLRIVQVGKIHSFAGQSGIIASLFTGLLCIAAYWAGVGLARLLVESPLKRFLSRPGAR